MVSTNRPTLNVSSVNVEIILFDRLPNDVNGYVDDMLMDIQMTIISPGLVMLMVFMIMATCIVVCDAHLVSWAQSSAALL
jgi:hypothetical protein